MIIVAGNGFCNFILTVIYCKFSGTVWAIFKNKDFHIESRCRQQHKCSSKERIRLSKRRTHCGIILFGFFQTSYFYESLLLQHGIVCVKLLMVSSVYMGILGQLFSPILPSFTIIFLLK